jgi:hypothetical protein
VPPADAWRFFDAAPCPKDLWVVPGARHGGYADAAPDQYGPRILGFFQDALGGNQLGRASVSGNRRS